MGVQGGSDLLYSAENLSIATVLSLAIGIARSKTTKATTASTGCIIYSSSNGESYQQTLDG